MEEKIISILLKVISSVRAFFWKTSPDKLHSEILVEYWRLFGASSVPLVMKVMEGFVVMPGKSPLEEYEYLSDLDDERYVIHESAMNFYRNLAGTEKLVASKRLLWEKYSGSQEKAEEVDFLAKPSSEIDIMGWIDENYIDQSGGDFEYPEGLWEKYEPHRKSLKNKTGFLFLTIKNVSKEDIRDLEIEFKSANISASIPTSNHLSHDFNFKKLANLFKEKGDPSTYLSTNPEFSQRHLIKIPIVEIGQRIIFLISVFRSDEEGLENGFLDDVFLPIRLIKKSLTPNIFFNIRKPDGKDALRHIVPYGWFRQ